MKARTLVGTETLPSGVPGSRVRNRRIAATVVACAVLLYVVRCLQLDFIADDAFISFRYARNVSQGLGFVFNVGERVEGYTNFLLVLLLALLHKSGADIVTAGRLVSIASGAAMVILTAALGRRGIPNAPWAGPAAALLLAVNPFVAAWGSAGLETTMFAAFVLMAVLPVAGGDVTVRRFLAASGGALFASLTRPEGVAVYALITFTLVIRSDGRRRSLSTLAPGLVCFLVVGGAYFLWRWNYFGMLLPNTYAAKAPFSVGRFSQGTFYVLAFMLNLCMAFAIPFAVPGILRLRRTAPIAAIVCAGLIAIVIAEGGDGLPIYRFMVPVVPFLLVAAVAYVATLRPKLAAPGAAQVVPVFILLILLVLSFFPTHDVYYRLYLQQRNEQIPRWREAGVALQRALPEDALIAAVPIGAVGWYSRLPVLDMVGLTDPVIARTPADPFIEWAGHEKHDGRYVLQRRPAALLLGNIFVSDSETPPTVPLPSVNSAFFGREGDILELPEFENEYRLATLPLDGGLYLHCYLRRDIVRNLR